MRYVAGGPTVPAGKDPKGVGSEESAARASATLEKRHDVTHQAAKQLMQAEHYDAVVEERSLEGLCGFPSCGKAVLDVPERHLDQLGI
eukprot:Skav229800  [mRNA]  locus=scaffold567:136733:137424:- [translate_table: standard]